MDIHKKILEYISLSGKVAVVTGAASGIGHKSAQVLADAGADVALLDIDEAKGLLAEKEIHDRGGNASFFSCDVSSQPSCSQAVAAVLQKFGKIDILFNNAGIIVRKNTLDLTEAEWDASLNITLKGIYLLSQQVIPHMIRKGGGTIINTGSGWAVKGGPLAVSYCAAKGGVLNLTRAMAIDHGQHNIRVNCICPGDIDTPMLRDEAHQLSEDLDQFLKEAGDRPIARVGTPEDVAKAVLFFASEMSSWITGAYLLVDGGGLA